MRHLRSAVCLLPVLALAACGSSGSSTGVSFDEYVSEALDLDDDIAGLPFDEPAGLPTTGNASYDGVIGAIVGAGTIDEVSVAGDLELTVQFAQNSITGNVTDIVDEFDGRYAGTLNITDGIIDRDVDLVTDFTFVADMSGNLTNPAGGPVSVDALLRGDFFGSGQYIAGEVSGNLRTDLGTTFIDGDFLAEER